MIVKPQKWGIFRIWVRVTLRVIVKGYKLGKQKSGLASGLANWTCILMPDRYRYTISKMVL